MRNPFFTTFAAAIVAVSTIGTVQAEDVASDAATFEYEIKQAQSIFRALKGGERSILDEIVFPHEIEALFEASREHYRAGETEQAYAKLRDAQRQLRIRFD